MEKQKQSDSTFIKMARMSDSNCPEIKSSENVA